MSNQKRILIARLGSMGDIIHTLPVAAALKDSFPSWDIDWLVEKRWRGLLDGNPCLSEIVEIDTHLWRKQLGSASTWREIRELRKRLRDRHYDFALDAQGAIKSAVCCWLSGANEILGFESRWLKEPLCRVFYSIQVAPTAEHIVEINLALAKRLGANIDVVRFPLPQGDPKRSPTSLEQVQYAVLNPGAGWRSKCWPPEYYSALADLLQRECGLISILNCGPGEETLAQQVQNNCTVANPKVFQDNLNGLIALLRKSKLMVGSDSGPLHLAAALGVPTLGLYGPTDPNRNGPYGRLHQSIRPEGAETSYKHSPEESLAMRSILPDQVFQSIQELFKLEKHFDATDKESSR